jgi:predicted DNA-binding transcriptional regulator AlpA
MSNEITPALLTVEQTCQFLNVGKTLFYSLQSSEKFGPLPIRLGRKVLYRRDELEAYISADMPPRRIWQQLRKERKL